MIVGRIVESRTDNKVKRFCDLHIPFLNKERFYIAPTPKERAKAGAPIFEVYGLYGRVGGIWERTSSSGITYKSMSIQGADRTFYFAIFVAKEAKEVKGGTLTHDVVYSIPKKDSVSEESRDWSGEQSAEEEEKIPF
ncbi:MAG: hypothetical protein ACTTH5_02915 [Wolinella sp.]